MGYIQIGEYVSTGGTTADVFTSISNFFQSLGSASGGKYVLTTDSKGHLMATGIAVEYQERYKLIQMGANELGAGLVVDGKIGRGTIDGLNRVLPERDPVTSDALYDEIIKAIAATPETVIAQLNAAVVARTGSSAYAGKIQALPPIKQSSMLLPLVIGGGALLVGWQLGLFGKSKRSRKKGRR